MKRVTAIGFSVCVAIMLTLGGCQEAPGGSDAPADAPAAPQPSTAAGDVPMFEFDPT